MCGVVVPAAHSSRQEGAHCGTRLWRVRQVIQDVSVPQCAYNVHTGSTNSCSLHIQGRSAALPAAAVSQSLGARAAVACSHCHVASAAAWSWQHSAASLSLAAVSSCGQLSHRPAVAQQLGCSRRCRCDSQTVWCAASASWVCRFKPTLDLIPGATFGHLREHKQKDFISGFQSIFAGQAPDPQAAGEKAGGAWWNAAVGQWSHSSKLKHGGADGKHPSTQPQLKVVWLTYLEAG